MERTMNNLVIKLKNSCTKHGEWPHYSIEDMESKIEDEFTEYCEALEKGDLYGPHGVASELLDVAVTCVKMAHQITLRKQQADSEDEK